MSNRILRPGSSFDTDYLLKEIINEWKSLEDTLNIEIDSKVISFLQRDKNTIDAALTNLGFNPPTNNLENWRFNVIQSLLWSRGYIVRNQHLEKYNPYQNFLKPERMLFSTLLLKQKDFFLVIRENDWKKNALEELEKKKQITLKFNANDKDLIQEFLNFITVNPVQDDYLSVYARLVSIVKVENDFELTSEIAEILQ